MNDRFSIEEMVRRNPPSRTFVVFDKDTGIAYPFGPIDSALDGLAIFEADPVTALALFSGRKLKDFGAQLA